MFIYAFNCSIRMVSALNLDYYGVESHIDEDKTITNTITLKFSENIQNIEYIVKYRIYDFKIKSGEAKCDADIGDVSIIRCNLSDAKNKDLVFSFKTKENVKMFNKNYEFSYVHPLEYDVKRFFNIIYLPKTAVLASDISNESFFPYDGKTLTDGRHIMVYWERKDLKKGDNLYFSINYKMPENGASSVFGLILAVLVAFAIIFILGFAYIKTTRTKSIKLVMPLLHENEKVVVNILKKYKGETNQRVIVRESDFSKAKVSRIISDLKERGIVEVEPMGRTNKVRLKIK